MRNTPMHFLFIITYLLSIAVPNWLLVCTSLHCAALIAQLDRDSDHDACVNDYQLVESYIEGHINLNAFE